MRWLVPIGVMLIACVTLLLLALVYPVPGGVSGCEGPHLPASLRYDGVLGEQWLRGWSHANRVRHEFWNAALFLALPPLALSGVGWFARRHRLLRAEFGLAVICLLLVLFSATTVDPVYYTAGC